MGELRKYRKHHDTPCYLDSLLITRISAPFSSFNFWFSFFKISIVWKVRENEIKISATSLLRVPQKAAKQIWSSEKSQHAGAKNGSLQWLKCIKILTTVLGARIIISNWKTPLLEPTPQLSEESINPCINRHEWYSSKNSPSPETFSRQFNDI